MAPVTPGRIFWKEYPGDRGDGKVRPMVALTSVRDIHRTKRVFAVVCSTDFDHTAILPDEVLLPHDPNGRAPTGLREPTVAVCDWTVTFDLAEIDASRGIVPNGLVREICKKVGFAYVPER